jgi:hypothetical protein
MHERHIAKVGGKFSARNRCNRTGSCSCRLENPRRFDPGRAGRGRLLCRGCNVEDPGGKMSRSSADIIPALRASHFWVCLRSFSGSAAGHSGRSHGSSTHVPLHRKYRPCVVTSASHDLALAWHPVLSSSSPLSSLHRRFTYTPNTADSVTRTPATGRDTMPFNVFFQAKTLRTPAKAP